MIADQLDATTARTVRRAHARQTRTTRARRAPTAGVYVLTVLAAASVLVSGYIHFYLYFRAGYRGIHPESFLGLTISRAFLLNAIGSVFVAEALVLSLRRPRLGAFAGLAAIGFAITTLGAYTLSRTMGLLGFTDTHTTAEALTALVAEVVALLAAAGLLKVSWTTRTGEA
jgi:hypothetical protein